MKLSWWLMLLAWYTCTEAKKIHRRGESATRGILNRQERFWIHCDDDHYDECMQILEAYKEDGLSVKFSFPEISAVVVDASEEHIATIKNHPLVRTTSTDAVRYASMIPPSAESIQRHIQDKSLLHRNLQSVEDEQETPYGVNMVQANLAWLVGATGANVTICIIDTGLDNSHEDLGPDDEGVALPMLNKWNNDFYGHGTAVSGVATALNNSIGVVGAAIDAKVFMVKTLDDVAGNFLYASAVVDAAYRCRDSGAKIISMSFDGGYSNDGEAQVFKDLYDVYGILSIASSGNYGDSLYAFPASYPNVISVGAIDSMKELAYFSQYNDMVDLVAPGVGVWTTIPFNETCFICDDLNATGYAPLDGTSFAAPYVAGVAALIWGYFPDASVQEVEKALLSTAQDLGRSGRDNEYGHGLVLAYKALEYLNGGRIPGGPLVTADGQVCVDDEILVEVNLNTDRYGNETSWEIARDSDGFTVIGGNGLSSRTSYLTSICLPSDCYTFTIYDSRSDG
jgi:subtilisin family serine protease